MPKIFKKKYFASSTHIFLIILILAVFLTISPPSKIEVHDQSHSDIPVGEMYGQMKVGQTFRADQNNLSAIEVALATFNRENRGTFVFHLKEGLTVEDNYFLHSYDMREVQDNTFFRFSFPKIKDSKGKTYYFFLRSPHAKPGNAITIWSSSKDSYKEGEKIINGLPSQGDLTFKTEYESGWRLSSQTLTERLMITLNFFLNLFQNKVFYFILLLMLSVWLVITFIKTFGIFQKKGGLFLVFGIVFFAVSLFIALFLMKKIEVYNQFVNSNTVGEIYGGKKVGQTFRAEHDHLMAIEVLMGTYKRKNTGELIFHLKKQGENLIDLYLSRVDMNTIKDNRYHRFKIPEIKNSQGRKYYFYLEAPNARPGNAITIWCNDEEDKYREGTSIINAEEMEGDLAFKTIYALGPWRKINLFLGEIRRNKPSPLNKKTFYVAIVVSFVLACSLFLTYLIRVFVETQQPKKMRQKTQI